MDQFVKINRRDHILNISGFNRSSLNRQIKYQKNSILEENMNINVTAYR